MTTNDNGLGAVESAFAGAYGKPAWGTALGVGSFLTVEFGPARPPDATAAGGARREARPHGEYHLWLYCSAWRIETEREIIASSEDPREKLAAAVRHLDDKVLAGVEVERPSLSVTLRFSDGTVLRTFSIFSTEYEHWMFFQPDGTVITAGPGSTWTTGR
jgi:hypothetical protein